MLRQFTAGAYILSEARVLLIFHRKMQKWLPPGGHVDANELPSQAAIREAYEETGLEIEIISDEYITVDRWNAKSLPRPFLCLLEEIPAHGDTLAHQHIDHIFLARPIGGSVKANLDETCDLRWFTLDEIEVLSDDADIFVETKDVIRSIFNLLNSEGALCERKPFLSQLQDSMLEKLPCA